MKPDLEIIEAKNLKVVNGIFDNKFLNASIYKLKNGHNVNINGKFYFIKNEKYQDDNSNTIDDPSILISPITGTIKEIYITENDSINQGDLIIKIEAMKLVLDIKAGKSGIIKNLKLKQFDKVSADEIILNIEE